MVGAGGWGPRPGAVTPRGFQTAPQSGEQELESLVLKLSVLKDFLSSIEKKVSFGVGGRATGPGRGWELTAALGSAPGAQSPAGDELGHPGSPGAAPLPQSQEHPRADLRGESRQRGTRGDIPSPGGTSPAPSWPRGDLPGPLPGLAAAAPRARPQVKLDVTLGDLTKIGKSQKYTLSVDVEGGKLVVLKKQKDSQEDWNTFTHDKSERGPWAQLRAGGDGFGDPRHPAAVWAPPPRSSAPL